MISFIVYCLFRFVGWVISLMPYRMIHAVGRVTGTLIYYLHVPFYKKTMTNLSIAFGNTLSENVRKKIAKRSFQSLMITCLEFFKLHKSQGRIAEIISQEGGKEILELLKKKQGIVFLTAHQANWEIPFLAVTEHAEGIAIGRPIKNKWLYNWVLSVREMNGGKIVMPKSALAQGLKALRAGKFIGIVGDQAFPESPYSYPLFGTRAWTTTAPALLSYKTNCPIVVCATKRIKGRYHLEISPPFWPNSENALKEETARLMDVSMKFLEESIRKRPHEWMWQHDRWKQQGIDHVKRKYRFGFVLIILPNDPVEFLPILPLFKKIYPRSFLTFLAPEHTKINLEEVQVIFYKNEKELLLDDWRYQIVLDFYGSRSVRAHYKNRGAFEALSLEKMQKISKCRDSLEEIIKKAIVKPECLSTDIF